MNLLTRALAPSLVLAAFGCKTAPEPKPVGDPQLSAQELEIVSQGLTDFTARFVGQVSSPTAATLEKASYELVVEGKPVASGELPLGIAVPAGGAASFQVEQSSRYVATPEDLKAMDARGGSLLVALRGKLHVRGGGRPSILDYARSREVRVPRLPSIKMHEIDAARYAADEVNAIFYVGVQNPNPFPIRLGGVDYRLDLAGKQLSEGTLGKGEKIAASSTGVFELHVSLNPTTYGPDAAKIIKGLVLPYVMTGQVTGELLSQPYDLKGEIKLNVSK